MTVTAAVKTHMETTLLKTNLLLKQCGFQLAGEAEQGGQQGCLPPQISQSLIGLQFFFIQLCPSNIFCPPKFW